MTLNEFLELNNAIQLFVAVCTLGMLLAYVSRKVRDDLGGWRGLPAFVRYDWLRHRERGAEIGSAFSAVVLGMVVRAAALWWWRYIGNSPADFPFLWVGLGGALTVAGLVCSIRVCANERRGSLWVAVLLGSVVFGVLTMAL
jgi:apolipoprotein N-acyltransferase